MGLKSSVGRWQFHQSFQWKPGRLACLLSCHSGLLLFLRQLPSHVVYLMFRAAMGGVLLWEFITWEQNDNFCFISIDMGSFRVFPPTKTFGFLTFHLDLGEILRTHTLTHARTHTVCVCAHVLFSAEGNSIFQPVLEFV